MNKLCLEENKCYLFLFFSPRYIRFCNCSFRIISYFNNVLVLVCVALTTTHTLFLSPQLQSCLSLYLHQAVCSLWPLIGSTHRGKSWIKDWCVSHCCHFFSSKQKPSHFSVFCTTAVQAIVCIPSLRRETSQIVVDNWDGGPPPWARGVQQVRGVISHRVSGGLGGGVSECYCTASVISTFASKLVFF